MGIFARSGSKLLSNERLRLCHVKNEFKLGSPSSSLPNGRVKLGQAYLYICCIFLHSDLDSVPFFVGIWESSILQVKTEKITTVKEVTQS